jgi:hypothetical protein
VFNSISTALNAKTKEIFKIGTASIPLHPKHQQGVEHTASRQPTIKPLLNCPLPVYACHWFIVVRTHELRIPKMDCLSLYTVNLSTGFKLSKNKQALLHILMNFPLSPPPLILQNHLFVPLTMI